MSSGRNYCDRGECALHNRVELDLEDLKKTMKIVLIDIEKLKIGKAESDETSDLKTEISNLSLQISTIIRERHEDKQFMQQLREELAAFSEELRQYAIQNASLEAGQKFLISTVTEMNEELKQIKKNTTFNWLEVVNTFFAANWIRKIISWSTLAILIFTIVASFVWLTTGQNLFPYIQKMWGLWFYS